MDEPSPADTGPALLAKGRGPLGLSIAAGTLVGAVLTTALLLSGPRADASLTPSGIEPDEQLISLMRAEATEDGVTNPPGFGSEMVIDLSTLRGFGSYRGFELWSAVNAFDSPCLIAAHRASVDIVARQCVPHGAVLFVDVMGHGMPEGERVRFQLRGDTVAAHVLVPDALD